MITVKPKATEDKGQTIVGIHAILFKTYLDIIGTREANDIIPLFKHKKDTQSWTDIYAPEDWVSEFNKQIFVKSIMAGEFKTRTTQSDRIIQPNLIVNDICRRHAPQISWPGENPMGDQKRTEEYEITEVKTSQVIIDLSSISNVRIFDGTLSENILDYASSIVAKMIDESVVDPSGHRDTPYKSILSDPAVFGHVSNDMKTAGGYVSSTAVDIEHFDGDVFKEALFHLPRGYRQRAKWVMNTKTAKALMSMKASLRDDGYADLMTDDDKRAVVDGVPTRLFNKSIIINDNMPDTGIVAYIGDMSRGYLLSKRPQDVWIRAPKDGSLAKLVFKIGGEVVQLACFKGIKFTPTPDINWEGYSDFEKAKIILEHQVKSA